MLEQVHFVQNKDAIAAEGHSNFAVDSKWRCDWDDDEQDNNIATETNGEDKSGNSEIDLMEDSDDDNDSGNDNNTSGKKNDNSGNDHWHGSKSDDENDNSGMTNDNNGKKQESTLNNNGENKNNNGTNEMNEKPNGNDAVQLDKNNRFAVLASGGDDDDSIKTTGDLKTKNDEVALMPLDDEVQQSGKDAAMEDVDNDQRKLPATPKHNIEEHHETACDQASPEAKKIANDCDLRAMRKFKMTLCELFMCVDLKTNLNLPLFPNFGRCKVQMTTKMALTFCKEPGHSSARWESNEHDSNEPANFHV